MLESWNFSQPVTAEAPTPPRARPNEDIHLAYFDEPAPAFKNKPYENILPPPAATGAARPPFPPRPDQEHIPSFFWLALTAAGCLALGVTVYGANQARPSQVASAGKDLRFGPPSSTFKAARPQWRPATTPPVDPQSLLVALETGNPPPVPLPPPPPGREVLPAPRRDEPIEPPVVDVLPPVPPPAPFTPPPAPLISLPPDVPRPPVAFEPMPALLTDEHPLLFTQASYPGDSPMMRNWKTLALYSLTVISIAAPAPVVVAQDNADLKKVIDRLDKMETAISLDFKAISSDLSGIKSEIQSIKNQVGTLQKDMNKLQTETLGRDVKLDSALGKVEQLENLVKALRAEVDLLKNGTPKTTAVGAIDKAGLDDIRVKLGSIEQAILKLQPPQSRVALAPPAASTGRVMLVNLYGEELLFVVNAKTYRVAPGASMPLDNIPAGVLSYEVLSPTWGLRARKNTALAANETFTLTAQ